MLLVLAGAGLTWPRPASAQMPTRQVTLFGIVATPGGNDLDPKLKEIEPQLRKVFPNHGYRLVGVDTKRIRTGQSLVVPLGDGLEAGAQLLNPLDPDGKVQLRVQLDRNQQIDFATLVHTPPNQLFFLDKPLPDGSRLILGLGARQ